MISPFILVLCFSLLSIHSSASAVYPRQSLLPVVRGVCATLAAALPGKVFYNGTVPYILSDSSYFTSFENDLTPSCIVRPQSAQDISTVIANVGPSAAGNVLIAIRGGGHTTWAGAANIDGGVTVDMQGLLGVTYDSSTSIAKIGAGARWADVYTTLAAQGVAVSGGRVSKVGVGGLTTGCGLAYQSAARGFVCDDVMSFEVVLASGDIVQANAQSNPDLFRALKGGNNNFGIVTRFDMQAFPQGLMWGGLVTYAGSAFPALANAFINFANDPSPDSNAHVIAAASFVQGQEFAVANIYHTTPEIDPPSLDPFVQIQPKITSTLRVDSLVGFTTEQSTFSNEGVRSWFFTTTWQADLDMMMEVRALAASKIATLSDVFGFVLALAFQPLTKGLLANSATAGSNSLGLSASDGPLVITMLQTLHSVPADDNRVNSVMLSLITDIENAAKRRGKYHKYKFMNYSYKTQDPISGYGASSIANMQAVSKKYDPQGFFQKTVPGGYKIPGR